MYKHISTFHNCMSVGRSQKTRRESMTENEVLSKGGREGNITM